MLRLLQLQQLQMQQKGWLVLQISADLAAVARYLRRQRNQYMEPFGLKSVHARYLIEVCENPGISQDGLTQRLGFDKSNVARQAALLEENGFLRRSPGEDKRILQLYPTDKTLVLLPNLRQAMEGWEQELTRDLTGDEKALLEKLLSKVRAKAEQED